MAGCMKFSANTPRRCQKAAGLRGIFKIVCYLTVAVLCLLQKHEMRERNSLPPKTCILFEGTNHKEIHSNTLGNKCSGEKQSKAKGEESGSDH